MAQDESNHFLRLIAVSKAIREHGVIWLTAILGVTFSLSVFLVIDKQFNIQSSVEFTWVAHNRNSLLKRGMENALEHVRLTKDYIQASGGITKDQFHIAVNPLLRRNPGLEMIGLILYKKNLEQHTRLSDQQSEGNEDVAWRESSRFVVSAWRGEGMVAACAGRNFTGDVQPGSLWADSGGVLAGNSIGAAVRSDCLLKLK